MKHILFSACDFLTKFIPFLAVFIYYKAKYKRRGIQMSKLHIAAAFAFSFYVICVLYVTGAGTLFETLRYFKYGMGRMNIHLIPFSEEINAFGYFANILMMLPFGFLLPLLSRKNGRFRTIFLSGFLFSLFIELSQLFNYRATDVDDLILNTLGAVFGFELCQVCLSLAGKSDSSDSYSVFEPFFYTAAMFLGHFFLFDGLGMASFIYGF